MTLVLTSVDPHCHRLAPQPPKIAMWASDLALLVTVQITACFPSLHLETDRCISTGGPRSTDLERPALSRVCTCACVCMHVRRRGCIHLHMEFQTSTQFLLPPLQRPKFHTATREKPPPRMLEKSPHSNEDPAQPKINRNFEKG